MRSEPVVDQIDARERRADERAHSIERELIDLFRPLGGEERVHDLANGHQLPQPEVGRGNGHEDAVGRGDTSLVTEVKLRMSAATD